MDFLLITQMILISCAIVVIVFLGSVKSIYAIALFVTFSLLLLQFLWKRKSILLFVWELAFLYIIGIEGFIYSEDINANYGVFSIQASKYLVLTFLLSVIGYLLATAFPNRKNKYIIKRTLPATRIVHYRSSFFTISFLILSYSIFLILNLNKATTLFFVGRSGFIPEGNLSFLIGSIDRIITISLPSVLCFTMKYIYKIKRSFVLPFLLSLPVFIAVVLSGTRLNLLFSLGSFLIVFLGSSFRINRKHFPLIFFGGLLLIVVGNLMLTSREVGLYGFLQDPGYVHKNQILWGSFYSNEGITKATSMLFEYFHNKSHLYGAQIAFIFIFWIPRYFWPNKPSMLGYWLLREFETKGWASHHNISFGFAGDAFADFGFLGGMLFSLLLGFLMRKLENRNKETSYNNINLLYMAFFYPFIFLAMRSLQTSLFLLIGVTLYLSAFKMTLIKKEFRVEEHQISRCAG